MFIDDFKWLSALVSGVVCCLQSTTVKDKSTVESIQTYVQMEILQTISRTLEDEGNTYHVTNQLKLKDGRVITAHNYYIRTDKPEAGSEGRGDAEKKVESKWEELSSLVDANVNRVCMCKSI